MKTVHKTCVVLMLALMLVSCMPQPATVPGATPALAPQQSAIAEVRVGIGDAALDAKTRQSLESLAELFETSHPDIKIILDPWGWNSQAFRADLAAGKVPDVMSVPPTEAHFLIDNGYLADMTTMMQAWAGTRDFNEPVLAPFVKAGRIYAVPTNIYVMGLFYDRQLFREAGLVNNVGEPVPPTTWDEFIAAAKAIKASTGAAGFCMFTQHNQGGWTFMNWGWQAGGEFERLEGGRWQAVFDEQPIVDAMQFIKELRWKHNVLQAELLLDVGQGFPMVARHQCGMAMFTPDWFEIVVNAHGGNPDDLGLTILPAGPAGHVNLMGGGYTVIRANASPEVQRAAFAWVTWRAFSLAALKNELDSAGGFMRWSLSSRSLMYKPTSETARRERELLDKYRNVPYYKTYVEEAGKYVRPEPPSLPRNSTPCSIRSSRRCSPTRTPIHRAC